MKDIFDFSTTDSDAFDSPIEMYKQGYRVGKQINGPLDYQSEIIDIYHKKHESQPNVAIQLPTGSGKTLTGLIIGEYRRRKYEEKVVFVCLNNLLVQQVFDQANEMYGIPAVKFTGSRKNYSKESISNYNQNKSIFITNYSSVFNNNSFFSDANTFIFDDVHSAENYISSPWAFTLTDIDDEIEDEVVTADAVLFDQISQKLQTIGDGPFRFTQTDQDMHIVDAMSVFSLNSQWREIKDIIDSGISPDSQQNYAWNNIKNHLDACQLYYDSHTLVIKPLFPPTLNLSHIRNANCKLYLSATFGETSQTLRNFGIEDLTYVNLPENKQPTGGRHYILFPRLEEESLQSQANLISSLYVKNKKMVILTKNNKEMNYFIKELSQLDDIQMFDIDTIKEFKESLEGVIVLSNRFDGVDFENDSAHLVIITDLSLAKNFQEKFLFSKINAQSLFKDQLVNRSIQALGRASRSENDYSVVVALGHEIQNELQSPQKRKILPKNLQAELSTGIKISNNIAEDDNPVEALSETIYRLSTNDRSAIERTEREISSALSALQNQKIDLNQQLSSTAKSEIAFNYDIWNSRYLDAFEEGKKIVDSLSGSALSGYRAFWSYMTSYVAGMEYLKSDDKRYKNLSKYWFSQKMKGAAKFSPWFGKVVPFSEVTADIVSTKYSDLTVFMISNIENMAFEGNLKSFKRNYRKHLNKALQKLKSKDGDLFEKGVEDIGRLLGFISKNSGDDSAPDPWWRIGTNTLVVSECKIIKNPISTKIVKQAGGHKTWIQKFEDVNDDTEIITAIISNEETIESNALTFADSIYFIDQNSLVDYVTNATGVIASKIQDIDEKGDELWYQSFEDALEENQCTPLNFLDLLRSRKLSSLAIPNKN
ncbi:MAG: DEAD/DEAH box helicase family protein [Leuconostoc pseudomesenteroides]|uniref:DEAD/DEAH box helicase family protein n=1 Tax=Leuconostoc pseudomesenteroides TaxID=33968 RepID=UPI0039E82221